MKDDMENKKVSPVCLCLNGLGALVLLSCFAVLGSSAAAQPAAGTVSRVPAGVSGAPGVISVRM